jgi:hypothetical protein
LEDDLLSVAFHYRTARCCVAEENLSEQRQQFDFSARIIIVVAITDQLQSN